MVVVVVVDDVGADEEVVLPPGVDVDVVVETAPAVRVKSLPTVDVPLLLQTTWVALAPT